MKALFISAVMAISADPAVQAVRCGVPRPLWMKQTCLQSCSLAPPINLVKVDSGDNIRWNGKPIAETTLVRYLRAARVMNPQPIVFLDSDHRSDCGKIERVRRLMDEELHCSLEGRCAEGHLADWERTRPQRGSNIVS